jgi:SAM-dependent methyltransferase
MTISAMQSYIETIAANSSLYEEKNFDKRMEVIDFIEFQIIDQTGDLMRKTAQPDQLILLKSRAEQIRSDLEEIDSRLFQRLQANIREEAYTGAAFKDLITEYLDLTVDQTEDPEEIGYDTLDLFINGLFQFQTMPEPIKDLEPEMVFFQKTPARFVFELVEQSHFMEEDVFFDLGSGLGQVAILVNLLAGIAVKGIEFEPAFCDYARNCVTELNLSNVTFINVDARKADYSEGTIFFMFTPFKGEILQEVLAILRKESLSRKIKIITYGPCTAQVALQSWLDFTNPGGDNVYKLGVFSTCSPHLSV